MTQSDAALTLDFDAYLDELGAETVPGLRVGEFGEITFATRNELTGFVVGFTKHKLQALATSAYLNLSDGKPTTLSELGADALGAVAQHLSPTEVTRRMRTCHAISVAATPRHPSWALLREDVQRNPDVQGNPVQGWIEARNLATERGDVQAMRYVILQGYGVASAARYAAIGGHVKMLKFLHVRTPRSVWDSSAYSDAARGGHLLTLQWLHALTHALPLTKWVVFLLRRADALRF